MKFFIKRQDKEHPVWLLYYVKDGKGYAMCGSQGTHGYAFVRSEMKYYKTLRQIAIDGQVNKFKKAIDRNEKNYSKYMVIDDN